MSKANLSIAEAEAEWLTEAGVPLVFRELVNDPALIPEPLRLWAEKIPACLNEGGSALLCGPPGTGKTAAATWFLRQVFHRWERDIVTNQWTGRRAWCFMVRGPDLVDALFAHDHRLMRQMRTVRVLVVDDWGMAFDKSGWGAAAFDDLIDRRWADRRLTIVTTNIPPLGKEIDSFERRYPRAASRLFDKRGPGMIVIDREDLRR